jgi:hypothetical protein
MDAAQPFAGPVMGGLLLALRGDRLRLIRISLNASVCAFHSLLVMQVSPARYRVDSDIISSKCLDSLKSIPAFRPNGRRI